MSSGFSMRLADVARALGAHDVESDVELTGVSTDTRTLMAGDLFVALKGENFDGHEYLAKAEAQGAVAALVERTVTGVALPQVIVGDARLAFGRIGALWRKRFNVPTLALTGSNGKTTVKEMLRSILVAHTGNDDEVLATEGNLNNDIGVPQMLLRLRPRHRYAVFELGMNHLGEIDYLTRMVEPDVAMVVMAGTAHIGELGSREAIAQAKGEIYGALKSEGIAVVNMHDRFGNLWRNHVQGHRVVGFGVSPQDDVIGTFSPDALGISSNGQKITVHLRVPGEHNQSNALAAAAGACALGIPLETIRRGLERFSGVPGRLRTFTGHNSATIIDDTYNANPDSVRAAIDVLAELPGPRLLVLGDMGEVGDQGPQFHAEALQLAQARQIEKIIVTGTACMQAAAPLSGIEMHAQMADVQTAVLAALPTVASVLVKGSRFMKMERVIEAMVQVTQQDKEAASC